MGPDGATRGRSPATRCPWCPVPLQARGKGQTVRPRAGPPDGPARPEAGRVRGKAGQTVAGPWRGYAGAYRCSPVYTGVDRCIPVYIGIDRCSPVYTEWCGGIFGVWWDFWMTGGFGRVVGFLGWPGFPSASVKIPTDPLDPDVVRVCRGTTCTATASWLCSRTTLGRHGAP